MKAKLSKMLRSGVAMLLVLCMVAGFVPFGAFAASEEINYVSLGDSMTNGYCFTGYNQGGGANIENGNGMYGYAAYPNQFASYLATETGKTVNHEKLAVSAMRAEDLNYLLGGREMPTDGWFSQVENYSGKSGAELMGIYQDAITDADVITMSIGNAAFGAYMVQYFTRMMGVMGGSLPEAEKVNLELALSVLEPDQKAVIMSAYNQMKAMAAGYIPEKLGPIDVQGLIDMMAYIGVGFLLNYEGVLDQIVELNPDVEVVLVGLMNTTYGMKITGEGFDPIPIGDIVDILFKSLNAYVAGLPAVKQAAGEWENAKFYYADMPNPEFIVQVYDDLYEQDWPADLNGLSGATVRARTIKAYNEALRPMIGLALGMVLPEVALNEVKDYEFDTYDEHGNGSGYSYQVMNKFSAEIPVFQSLFVAAGYNKDAVDYTSIPLVKRYVDAKGIPDPSNMAAIYANCAEVFAADVVKEISISIYLALEESLAKSVNNMEITLEGLLGIAGDIFNALGDMPAELNPANNPGPYVIKTALVNWFTGSPTGLAMCKVFAMFKVGDGMSVHPTPAAHANIAASVKAAYRKNTVQDETQKNVEFALGALKGFLEEYGPEAAEQAYTYLEENGYIEMAEKAVEDLVAYLVAEGDALAADLIPAVEAAIAELEAQNEELKAALVALKADLEAKKAELESAVGEAAAEIEVAIAEIEAAIAAIEAAIADLEIAITDLKATADNLLAAVEELGTQIEDVMASAAALNTTLAELVNSLKNTGSASVESIAAAYQMAREAVLDAAKIVEEAVELVTVQADKVAGIAAELNTKLHAMYEGTAAALEQIINDMPANQKAIIGAAVLAVEKGLEAAIALVEENLDEAIAALKAELCPEIAAKKAELEAILAEIDAHVAEKSAGLKAAAEAQIAELEAHAEAKIAEVKAAAEAQIAEVEAAAQAQIAEVEAQIAEVKAAAEAQIAAIEAAAQAQIAELEAHIAEKQAELAALNAQLENAAEELKAEIEAQIAAIEAEIINLNAQVEAINAQAKAQIDALNAHVVEMNAKVEAIIAETQAKVEAINAELQAKVEEINAELKAAVETIDAELQAAVAAIRAEVEATYAETVTALETAIAELEAHVEAEIAKLQAAAEAEIAKLQAIAEAEIAKLNQINEEITAIVDGVLAQIEDQLNTVDQSVKALMNSSLENVEALAKQLGEDLLNLGEDALDALVDEVNAVLYDAFVKATTSDLELGEDSIYVALGDGTAESVSYVDLLKEKLETEYGVETINHAKAGNTIGAELDELATREGIADAALITIGFGNTTMLENAIRNAGRVEYDWVSLVGEELLPYVEDALADVYAEIAAANLGDRMTAYANSMVEGFAYAAVEYAVELPKLIAAIRTVNTDAVIVVVGQYNPMDGVVLDLEDNGNTLDFSDYINYFVDAVAVHGIGYAMITGDAIFVEAPEVDTTNTDKIWDFVDLAMMIGNKEGFEVLNPSEAGDGYIANQILDALNISKIPVKPASLLGDVNDDGVVDFKDVVRLRKYFANPDSTEINVANSDVNLDGEVNFKDLVRMRKHFADGVAFG